jgi:hypothetical protein
MSKVTEELDFLWQQRLSDLYNEMIAYYDYEGTELIKTILKIQGLSVKGIE